MILVQIVLEHESWVENNSVTPSTVCGIAIETENRFAAQAPTEGGGNYSIRFDDSLPISASRTFQITLLLGTT